MRCEDFFPRLVRAAQAHQLTKLGSAGGFPIYKCVINHQKTTGIAFCAGVHGNESAGPLAVLQLLETTLNFPDYRIALVPLANPYGFEHNIRRNQDGIDLNRHFYDKPLGRHNSLIWRAFKTEQLKLAVTLHEDIRHTTFYTYFTGFEPLVVAIRDLARTYFPIERRRNLYGDHNKQGLVAPPHEHTGCFEDRIWKEKHTPYIMTETPAKRPLEQRIEATLAILQLVLNSPLA